MCRNAGRIGSLALGSSSSTLPLLLRLRLWAVSLVASLACTVQRIAKNLTLARLVGSSRAIAAHKRVARTLEIFVHLPRLFFLEVGQSLVGNNPVRQNLHQLCHCNREAVKHSANTVECGRNHVGRKLEIFTSGADGLCGSAERVHPLKQIVDPWIQNAGHVIGTRQKCVSDGVGQRRAAHLTVNAFKRFDEPQELLGQVGNNRREVGRHLADDAVEGFADH